MSKKTKVILVVISVLCIVALLITILCVLSRRNKLEQADAILKEYTNKQDVILIPYDEELKDEDYIEWDKECTDTVDEFEGATATDTNVCYSFTTKPEHNTVDLWLAVEDKVNEYIFNLYGEYTHVVYKVDEVRENGNIQIYEITFSDKATEPLTVYWDPVGGELST